jgi:hypothetical protein
MSAATARRGQPLSDALRSQPPVMRSPCCGTLLGLRPRGPPPLPARIRLGEAAQGDRLTHQHHPAEFAVATLLNPNPHADHALAVTVWTTTSVMPGFNALSNLPASTPCERQPGEEATCCRQGRPHLLGVGVHRVAVALHLGEDPVVAPCGVVRPGVLGPVGSHLRSTACPVVRASISVRARACQASPPFCCPRLSGWNGRIAGRWFGWILRVGVHCRAAGLIAWRARVPVRDRASSRACCEGMGRNPL